MGLATLGRATLGLTTLGLTLGFGVRVAAYDLHIIDEIWREDAIRAVVEAMSAEQRVAHIRMTQGIDVAYPVAYGAFLMGLAYRAWVRATLGLPEPVTVPVDLVEGAAQVAGLTGAGLAGHVDGLGAWGMR